MDTILADEELSLELVPPPGAKWAPDIRRLAATFDGYSRLGSQVELAKRANPAAKQFRLTGEVPVMLLELRVCLFFEYRRNVHMARDPDEEPELMKYVHALVEAMRVILARR